MPTVLDATVYGQPYETSGNGGRKLVRLDNGWLLAVVKNYTTQYYEMYISRDNGITWTYHMQNSVKSGNLSDVALAHYGNTIYVIISYTTWVGIEGYDLVNTKRLPFVYIDQNQTSFGNVSLTINSIGTELHATWASKGGSYPNSFNIRYAKGIIGADGSLTWGDVEQVTTLNASGADEQNPTITLDKNSSPVIFNERTSPHCIKTHRKNGSSWTDDLVYNTNASTYAQSSPSSIFVPSSVNGLPNGRIWVAWADSTALTSPISETGYNIAVSYSDDSGATWSAIERLTTGVSHNDAYPSITASSDNTITIVYANYQEGGIRKVVKPNGSTSWNAPRVIKNTGKTNYYTYPSALYNPTLKISEPIFVYKDLAKVGFYGSWSVATISVPVGYIGEVDDKTSILNYTITSDTMETITEKINGVVVGTKNASSGDSLVVSVSDDIWDTVRYGKYSDTGLNTLTIEMGDNNWEYTFSKVLSPESDIAHSIKATQDANEVVIPKGKELIANAIKVKGGNANSSDTFEMLAENVSNIVIKKKAAVTVTSASTNKTFTASNGSSFGTPWLEIDTSLLGFEPRLIVTTATNKDIATVSTWSKENIFSNGNAYGNANYSTNIIRVPYVKGLMSLPVQLANKSYTCEIFE